MLDLEPVLLPLCSSFFNLELMLAFSWPYSFCSYCCRLVLSSNFLTVMMWYRRQAGSWFTVIRHRSCIVLLVWIQIFVAMGVFVFCLNQLLLVSLKQQSCEQNIITLLDSPPMKVGHIYPLIIHDDKNFQTSLLHGFWFIVAGVKQNCLIIFHMHTHTHTHTYAHTQQITACKGNISTQVVYFLQILEANYVRHEASRVHNSVSGNVL